MSFRATPAILKHVGRGARLAKDMEPDEAREIMRRIAAAEADPVQIGAFLIALRMKGESAGELAGFTLALRDFCAEVPGATVDLELHADGREDRPTVALAAACVAAACGVRVLVRGRFENRFAKNDVGEAFRRLGVDPVRGGIAAATRALDACGVGVLDLGSYAPRVAELLDLREPLGVRTCLNSVVKLLDPARTARLLVGIFHSPYHAPMGGAALALGVARAAIVQAPGGVPELAPDKRTRVSYVDGGVLAEPVDVPGSGDPMPSAPDAASLAALLEHIFGGTAPAGLVRSTIATADLILWAAGREPAAAQALAAGSAARVFNSLRVCYTT